MYNNCKPNQPNVHKLDNHSLRVYLNTVEADEQIGLERDIYY